MANVRDLSFNAVMYLFHGVNNRNAYVPSGFNKYTNSLQKVSATYNNNMKLSQHDHSIFLLKCGIWEHSSKCGMPPDTREKEPFRPLVEGAF